MSPSAGCNVWDVSWPSTVLKAYKLIKINYCKQVFCAFKQCTLVWDDRSVPWHVVCMDACLVAWGVDWQSADTQTHTQTKLAFIDILCSDQTAQHKTFRTWTLQFVAVTQLDLYSWVEFMYELLTSNTSDWQRSTLVTSCENTRTLPFVSLSAHAWVNTEQKTAAVQ